MVKNVIKQSFKEMLDEAINREEADAKELAIKKGLDFDLLSPNIQRKLIIEAIDNIN